MKNYIVYNKTTGEIIRNGMCSDDSFDLQASELEGLVEGIGTFFTCFIKENAVHYYTAEQSVLKQTRQLYYMQWSNESFSWVDQRSNETRNVEQWIIIKSQRNQLLISSDWTQMPDVSITTKAAWADYRQQLRDIPIQPDPFNIIWPTSP
jgi:hypothetical protein